MTHEAKQTAGHEAWVVGVSLGGSGLFAFLGLMLFRLL